MVDRDPLPHGPAVALRGLEEAIDRLDDAVAGLMRGGGAVPAVIAASEGLFWVGSLDDAAKRLFPDYWERREVVEAGRVTAGLVYARNFHVHQLISTAEAVTRVGTFRVVKVRPGESPPAGSGPLFSIQLRWEEFARLPLPEFAEKHGRDLMYEQHVAGRGLSAPLSEAHSWFSRVFG